MSQSVAIKNILYAWGLAFSPHVLKLFILRAGGHLWDNKKGRHNMTDPKAIRASPIVIARAQRADAAHQNGMESFPLFAIASLVAVYAGVDVEEVATLQKAYLGLRLLYNIIFIVGGNDAVALSRTLVWGSSVYTSISLLLKSSRALAAKGL
ncbi:hypothetical protein E2P81_ATG10115 [Venturia nashicola]|uniref:Uncharacterized protein n=1 Tax=Venturia nashicola TaxID=86259 RepID=A0A4Z1NG80_9PEZI|nr:hypothetical protein E6O75_ATG10335 [Venturia nashicola]TLD14574.1 hypothetical protein E2P81_ATG10115 [Venturia nashicola]